MGGKGEIFVAGVFFLVFKLSDIYSATASAMICQLLVTLFDRCQTGKFQPLSLAALAVVWTMGTLTLAFHDETFVKMKPSILYLISAGALGVSRYGMKVNLIQRGFEDLVIQSISANYYSPTLRSSTKLRLPSSAWDHSNLFWIFYFIALSLLNFYIALNYSTEVWVNFKLFGALLITVLASFIQLCALSFVPPEEYEPGPEDKREGEDKNGDLRLSSIEQA